MKDVLTGFIGSSGYPTVCGNYGICTSYFRLINDKLPNHGYAPYLLLTNYPPDVNVRICERNSVLHYLETECTRGQRYIYKRTDTKTKLPNS